MYVAYGFCSHLILIKWLQNHLLPCPFKLLTGIDCPGCGFQRSLLSLIEGNFNKSIQLYPGTIPLLLTAIYFLIPRRYQRDQHDIIKKTSLIITGSIILITYVLKMAGMKPGWI